MHTLILGYSESTISRLLDSLELTGYSGDLVIVQNMGVKEEIPFCPPGIKIKKLFWDQLNKALSSYRCLLGVSKPGIKKTVYNFFLENCGIKRENYFSLSHPDAVISSTTRLDTGCFIEPGVVLASFARLGFGVLVNRGSTIGHHTNIGDFTTINPGVHIAGHCSIGEGVQVGIGTAIFDHIRIGKNSVIGGGSVVTKDIPENVLAWGNPCRVVKELEFS